MFYQTISVFSEHNMILLKEIFAFAQKISLSLLVITVWTLGASTNGPPFKQVRADLAR